jgi:hypothetical protein
MKIVVAQEHIDKGRTGSCSKCPIALAAHDIGLLDAMVTENGLYAYTPYRGGKLSPKASLFVKKFDLGKKVLPFEFEFEFDFHTSKRVHPYAFRFKFD